MVTIAMLGQKSQASKLKLALASIAKLRNVVFFYFTPEDVQYEDKKIRGTYHTGEKWEQAMFDYPDYIYDRMLFRGKKRFLKLYEEFRDIPFNNEKPEGGSLSKTKMYEVIEENKHFVDYLIPYTQVNSMDDIYQQLEKYHKIICKADEGSLGVSVYMIEKKQDHFIVQIQREQKRMQEEHFQKFVEEKIVQAKAKFVMQPFIRSQTVTGNPFDIRAHLMKNQKGEWTIAKIYPRIGASNSVVSNLHLGGSTCDLNMFLNKHLDVENPKELQKTLQNFAKDFARKIEPQFDFHFSELGLDIAIDEDERIWLFEVNMNRVNIRYLTLEAANLAISYGKYVVLQNKKEQQSNSVKEQSISSRIFSKFFK